VDESGEPRGQTTDGCFASCIPIVDCLNPSHRKKEGLELPQGDLRARFYERYRKEAEEYDKGFMKKYDEDLNTTLIFVRCAHRSGTRVLTRVTGWSVFRRHFSVHHPSPLRVPARPERRDSRSPPCPHPQNRQHHIRRRRSRNPTALVWSRTHGCPGSGNPPRESHCFTLLRLPGDARQAVVEPIRIDRQARVCHRAQPRSATQARRHRCVVF